MEEQAAKIFLVDPLDKTQYKEMIVYADNATEARRAASAAFNQIKRKGNGLAKVDPVYLDEGMSICIETEEVEILGTMTEGVKIKYRDVIYELYKNKAETVINESIL